MPLGIGPPGTKTMGIWPNEAAPMNRPGTILSQMPNNMAPSKASWESDTAVANAITSRLNSDSSMPARPCVTPSHMAGTPPATCAVAPTARAAARITSGYFSKGWCADNMSLYDVTTPMFGMACCNRGLSSPEAARTCARFEQASLPRAGSTSLRLRVRSRYSPRVAAERPPIRSVTSAITSWIFCLSLAGAIFIRTSYGRGAR